MVIKASSGSSFPVGDPVTAAEEWYHTDEAGIAVRRAAAQILLQH